jgi:hypothetical protein
LSTISDGGLGRSVLTERMYVCIYISEHDDDRVTD